MYPVMTTKESKNQNRRIEQSQHNLFGDSHLDSHWNSEN